MRAGLYPKLAWEGIRKNKRLYLPFIFTCVGVIAMYYIVAFLSTSSIVADMPGGGTIQGTLGLGSGVLAVFSVIFLFYTNSFLIRRRKKEFGLYNILGMGKRNIAAILLWETVITAVLSLAVGLAVGIGLSKLVELVLFNVMGAEVQLAFSVSVAAILRTLVIFGGVFLLLLLNAIRQIHVSDPITLMRSENLGEKPPRANWVMAVLGAALLAAAYYVAATLKDPVTAIMLFFVAVIMVIIATYMLFVAGSVTFCRLLQKNKRYYYKPNHFVSVSSMVYRMKRNGAGLASICILVTMVLVMLSASACLYFGAEDSLMSRYPREINIDVNLYEPEDMGDEQLSVLRGGIGDILEKNGIQPTNISDYRFAVISGKLTEDIFEPDVTKAMASLNGDLKQISIISLADYNGMTERNVQLAPDEILMHTVRETYEYDTLTINGGTTFRVKETLDEFPGSGDMMANVIPPMFLVVPNLAETFRELNGLIDFTGDRMLALSWNYAFDTGVSTETQIVVRDQIKNYLDEYDGEDDKLWSQACSSRERERAGFYGTFVGILFLAILLSIVFLFATVLIIYYKQISEGYEDQSRFEIMRKVGMTKRDIRKSIHSQMLTVFLLPLIAAVVHLVFAFPMIRMILMLFNMTNITLFVITTGISIAVFAVIYTIIYKITSNAYYGIVSGAKEVRG